MKFKKIRYTAQAVVQHFIFIKVNFSLPLINQIKIKNIPP